MARFPDPSGPGQLGIGARPRAGPAAGGAETNHIPQDRTARTEGRVECRGAAGEHRHRLLLPGPNRRRGGGRFGAHRSGGSHARSVAGGRHGPGRLVPGR